MGKLSPKQMRFIDEYLLDLNGTQAAIRAGYSPNSAQEQASVLLSKPMIAKIVSERQAEQAHRCDISKEWVLKRLISESQITKDQGGTHSGRMRALELLAKHLGMLTDRLMVTGDFDLDVLRRKAKGQE